MTKQYSNVLICSREPYGQGKSYLEKCKKFAYEFLDVSAFKIVSDYPGDVDYYMDLKSIKLSSIDYEHYKWVENNLNITSIIKNERAFRYSVNYVTALDLIIKCSYYFRSLISNNRFDAIVINLIDNYILDILDTVACFYNIQIYSLAGNSFNSKYSTVTRKGELNAVRSPKEEEVLQLYNQLRSKKQQPYQLSKITVLKGLMRNYFVYKIKYVLHYLIFFKLLGRVNYRYISTTAAAYPKSLYQIILSFYYLKVADLSFSEIKLPKVYIPLHYHPEATTEYFIRKDNYLSYYPSLFKVIRFYSERGYLVVLKEHTSMFGKRPIKIYKTISEITNTVLLNPFVSTFNVLDKVDITAIWTGTTGVEAVINDYKIVLTETDVYYNSVDFSYMDEDQNIKLLNRDEKLFMLKNILGGFFIH